MKATDIDLNMFCDPVHECESIRKPFVLDGYKVATDSAICVFVPCSEENTRIGERMSTNVSKLLEFAKSTEKVMPIQIDDCIACHGLGTVLCNLGCEHMCRTCCGQGNTVCDTAFSGGYLNLILTLPGKLKCAVRDWNEGKVMIVSSGEILAALMSLKWDGK